MKTLAVIGVYGTGGDFATSQGVKCRTMVNWLKRYLSEFYGIYAQTPHLQRKHNGEVIRNGVDGFLYPCHDNEAATGRLVSLYHSAELYADICRECRERAKGYSTERVMGRFVSELA